MNRCATGKDVPPGQKVRSQMCSWMTYLLPIFMFTISGCAHFAKIPTWRAAAVPVNGVETVAVLPFEGEWGNRVAEEVSDAFSESGAYTIVSVDSFPPSPTAGQGESTPSLDQLLVAARKADVDAVLVGTILAEEPHPPEEVARKSFSRKANPRNRSMTVDYRLVDTRTGETLSQNRISCLEPELKTVDEQVQQTLIQRCGLEVVSQLTPQCGACSIALANCAWTERGGISVRQGVRAAEKGNWGSAVKSWEAALRVNPENDAAIFNLALAAASEGDFENAEERALEALRIQHSDCYEQGLETIRQQRSQFEDASRQQGNVKLSSLERSVQ